MLILFSTEENHVSFLCCCFAKVLPSHFAESKDDPSVPVHFVCMFLEFPCSSWCLCVPRAYGVYSTNLRWCTSSILDTSVLMYSGRHSPCWPGRWPIQYDMVAGFHHMVSHRQGTTWRSPSLSRSYMWPLRSLWNLSAHLALVFELWRHRHSDAMLTPAISPITGRLVEGGSVLFLPILVYKLHGRF